MFRKMNAKQSILHFFLLVNSLAMVLGRSCFGVRPFVSNYHRSKEIKLMDSVPRPVDSSLYVTLRGGDGMTDFANYIGSSRNRSWAVLFLAILLDTGSATLMKIGRDEGSMAKLLVSYCGFFLRYVGITGLVN